jgi:hypothetical protein
MSHQLEHMIKIADAVIAHYGTQELTTIRASLAGSASKKTSVSLPTAAGVTPVRYTSRKLSGGGSVALAAEG